MTFRFTSRTLFGATAMLTLGAVVATGQDTSRTRPRSDRRLPISKEAAGEVLVRTDTVMVYRTDTVQLTRRVVDTLRVTRTRIDTVIPRLAAYRYPAGFYGGLAGGFSTPSGALYTPNSTGGAGQLQLGWQNAKQVLGARLDWTGQWPGRDSRFSRFQRQASVQSFSLSGKVQYPFNFGGEKYQAKTDPCEPAKTVSRGPFHRFAIYGIGGFTYTTYRNLPMRLNTPDNFTFTNINDLTFFNGDSLIVLTDANNAQIVNGQVVNGQLVNGQRVAFFTTGDDDWHGRGGWNAGGGLSMFWGHSELFVEARVIGFKARNNNNNNNNFNINGIDFGGSPQARMVPVVLGLNFY